MLIQSKLFLPFTVWPARSTLEMGTTTASNPPASRSCCACPGTRTREYFTLCRSAYSNNDLDNITASKSAWEWCTQTASGFSEVTAASRRRSTHLVSHSLRSRSSLYQHSSSIWRSRPRLGTGYINAVRSAKQRRTSRKARCRPGHPVAFPKCPCPACE